MSPSSRGVPGCARGVPIGQFHGIDASPESWEHDPKVYVALAELLEGEALDIVQITARGSRMDAWRKLVRRFDPQTVGRKRTWLRRNLSPGTMKVLDFREPLNVERNVSGRISPERQGAFPMTHVQGS